MTPEWHAAYVDRWTRHHIQLRAVTPRRCPNCGAGVRPLFWRVKPGQRRLDVYGCVRLECHTVISGRGD